MPTFLSGYSEELQDQVANMLEKGTLGAYLLKKYPEAHRIQSDAQLYDYTQALKKQFLRKSPPLQKVFYSTKLSAEHQALGINRHRIMSHGKNLKTKKEIRIAAVFKKGPEDFLRMIVGHELAHLKEMEHNKAFFSLCEHIVPDYHQIEFDMRCYLMLEERGDVVW